MKKNLIIDLLKRLEKRKKDEININGFIWGANVLIYLDVNIFIRNDIFNYINVINQDNYNKYLDIDIILDYNRQMTMLNDELTINLLLNNIILLLFDETLTYNKLKNYVGYMHGHNYIYPVSFMYYDYYTDNLKQGIENYLFSIDLY